MSNVSTENQDPKGVHDVLLKVENVYENRQIQFRVM